MSESSNNFNKKIESGIGIQHAIAPDKIKPSGGTPDQETVKTPRNKRGIILGAIGAVAAAAIAVPVFIGISSEHSSQGAKPPKAVESSAPASPTETTAPTPSATPETVTVASLEIPATTPPEQVGAAVVNSLSGWFMAGANDETYKERLAFHEDNKTTYQVTADFVNQKAETLGNVRAEALFGQYQSDPNNAKLISGLKMYNASFLENYIITHNDGSVFNYSMTTDSTDVVSHSNSSLSLNAFGTEHTNAAQNRIGTQYDPSEIAIDGNKFEIATTLVPLKGAYKVSQISIVNTSK
ncbi:hypothetical protein BH09PAT4_BH09PAT4_09260 [soil metagenome]